LNPYKRQKYCLLDPVSRNQQSLGQKTKNGGYNEPSAGKEKKKREVGRNRKGLIRPKVAFPRTPIDGV